MDHIPDYKLKIFVDALQVHLDREPVSVFAEDDLAALPEDWTLRADECGDDIAADLVEIQTGIRKGRRAASRKKYAQSEQGKITRKAAQKAWNQTDAGKAAKAAWNQSAKGKAAKLVWNQSAEGRAAKRAWRRSPEGKAAQQAWRRSPIGRAAKKAWNQSDAGKVAKAAWYKTKAGQECKQRELAAQRAKSLDRYLNRIIVTLDSEGRCPLHMIDSEGRTPLEAYKATGCLKYLTKDSSGHYWEPHELSLIGAATIDRPYGTPIERGVWQEPIWIELTPKNQSEQTFEYLLSLPEHYFPAKPLYMMFSAGYDWSMWLRDTPFGKAFEIARQRAFEPPCKRMRGMVFWKKYAIKVRPYFDFKLSELRWPDDPYGLDHKDDPAYQKPGKRQTKRLQTIRRITIIDTFRFSPKSFVETIKPLMKRGLIPQEIFNTIEREKQKRGGFHLEPMQNIKKYCGYELHSLCVLMHMIRDACWTSAELRLKSFPSPAAISSELLERINVRSHSWPVKSVDPDYEQVIGHWAYFGGRFEWVPKGYMRTPGYQVDLASAYPYAMQFLPSMAGGHWEKWDVTNPLLKTLTRKTIEQSCILSIFRVRFNFYADAPFYALPYRMPDSIILYPRMGYGYYMRDDVLNAFDWCKKYKIPVEKAIVVEEANFFHPAEDAVRVPFALIADIYMKRIEFDKKDPKGPEQGVLKGGINSSYGKLAERRFRGLDPKTGNPIIPPHACPWYASAITAHTRRELMKVALLAPECVIGFATDAIYFEAMPNIPRLKAEADIDAGKTDKLLGDWCWSKVPAAVFIQSGLALYLDEEGKVAEVKCRGLPLKKKEKAQKFLEAVLEAWKAPYNPDSIDKFGHKTRPPGRHASVEIRAFMALPLAVTSPNKFNNFFCKWGDITKTVWLDDCGGKRTIDMNELDLLATEAIPTSPKENPTPDVLSALRFPDWVENAKREKKRQEAAVSQFFKLDEIANWLDLLEDEEDERWGGYDGLSQLLEANEDIEV